MTGPEKQNSVSDAGNSVAANLLGSPSTAFLSVVVPVYNEASRIPATLRQVLEYLKQRPENCEVVVVDDGSTDDTVEQVQAVCREAGNVRLLRHAKNQGKGAAVQTGMLAARGECLLFTDADLSTPIAELERLLDPLRDGYDIVIGSRALKREWVHPRQPWLREYAGRAFNVLVRRIAGLDFRDTQCGFKVFRRPAAQAIFSTQQIAGFGFDVEVLYLARKFGYRALEVPVHWANDPRSQVRLFRDAKHMFSDLLRIRWNDWRGKYRRPSARA